MKAKSWVDTGQRLQAITTPHHAFVWAGAGTGKTHTLTLRGLYLILNAPFLPEERSLQQTLQRIYSLADRAERLQAARLTLRSLALTTFTRKAAAEMQGRIHHYLDLLASSRSLADLARKQSDPLFHELVHITLDNISERSGPLDPFALLSQAAQMFSEVGAELQVCTLHSLAFSILMRHPLQARLPFQVRFAVEEDSDLAMVPDRIVDSWWERVLKNLEVQRELTRVLPVVPMADLRVWLKQIYQQRWLVQEVETFTRPAGQEIESALQACRSLSGLLEHSRGRKTRALAAQLRRIVTQIESRRPSAWVQMCRFLKVARKSLFQDGRPPLAVQKALHQLPEHLAPFFQSWPVLYNLCLRACLHREHGRAWTSWKRILADFLRWVETSEVQKLGFVTFDETIRFAVRLLQHHPQVRSWEQRRLRAILVDEFQDTDPDQLELIRLLLGKDTASGREVLGFFVGDFKQSIYRFRGVDLSRLQHFHQYYRSQTESRLPLENFRLSTTFRSLPPVIRFVNSFFGETIRLAGPEEELQPYRNEPGKPPQWILPPASQRVSQAREEAAWETARRIRSLREKAGASWQDILVLVRKEKELGILVPILQRAGIPVNSSGARTFYRQPEVLDLLNLLIALHHPGDSLSAASVLASPSVGLSPRQIHTLVGRLSADQIFHGTTPLPPELLPSLQSRIAALRTLAGSRIHLSLKNWLREIRRFLPSEAYLVESDREGRALMRINQTLRTFYQEVEEGAAHPLVWLLQQRRRAISGDRWDADLGEDVVCHDEGVDTVRVMTIHKAKGLESRFVIVFGWHSVLEEMLSGRDNGERRAILTTHVEGQALRCLRLPWGPVQLESSRFQEALQMDRQAARAEAKCLAYVAATRARDGLIFLSPRTLRSRIVPPLQNLIDSVPAQGGSDLACGDSLELSRPRPSRRLESPVPRESVPLDGSAHRCLWEKKEVQWLRWAASPIRPRSAPETAA